MSSQQKGAQYAGSDFPSDLFDERFPKDMVEIHVMFFWRSTIQGTPQPDKELIDESPLGTGRYVFPNNQVELAALPSWLMSRNRTGTWCIDFMRPNEARYALRWEVFLGAPQQPVAGGVPLGGGLREHVISGGTSTIGGGGGDARRKALPPPGSWIFSRELGTYVQVGTESGPPAASNAPNPEIVALRQQLDAMTKAQEKRDADERVRLAQEAAEKARLADKAEFERQMSAEREARKQEHAALMAQLKELAAPKPPEKSTLEIVSGVATALQPVLAPLLSGSQKREELMFAAILDAKKEKPSGPSATETILLEMVKSGTQDQFKMMEQVSRTQLEAAGAVTQMFTAMKENEPEISPVADIFGKVVLNAAGLFAKQIDANARGKASQQRAVEQIQAATAQPRTVTRNVAVQPEPAATPQPREMSHEETLRDAADNMRSQTGFVFDWIKKQVKPAAPVVTPAPVDAPGSPSQSNGEVTFDWPVGTKLSEEQVASYIATHLPSDYQVKPWIRLLTAIHNEEPADEVGAALANYLTTLHDIDAMPPGLEALEAMGLTEQDVMSTLAMIAQLLPINERNPVYTNEVLSYVAKRFVENTGEGDEDEGEDEDESESEDEAAAIA